MLFAWSRFVSWFSSSKIRLIVSRVLYDNPLVIAIDNTQSFFISTYFSINFMDLVLVVKKLDVEMTKDSYKTVINDS